MKLIVGLGNPGPKYVATRHNVGFEVVDLLAARWRIDLSREKFHGWFGDGAIHDERVALLKPTTFMNRSGQAVLAAVAFYALELLDVMVVGDDLALPCGRIRLRRAGSAGGHNGLLNIVERLGSDEFPRLRLGIDAAWGDAAQYVLTAFGKDEEPVIRQGVENAANAVEHWVQNGIEKTMNRFNAKEEV